MARDGAGSRAAGGHGQRGAIEVPLLFLQGTAGTSPRPHSPGAHGTSSSHGQGLV